MNGNNRLPLFPPETFKTPSENPFLKWKFFQKGSHNAKTPKGGTFGPKNASLSKNIKTAEGDSFGKLIFFSKKVAGFRNDIQIL